MADFDATTDVPVDSRPVAMESVRHRRGSRIGTEQRYYLLSRPMVVGADVPRAVLVIPDPPRNSCHVYPAASDGDIADFWQHRSVAGTTDPELALAQLGYRVSSFTLPVAS
ncbi:hypothetical protein [Tsukamurella tyrosinosolvens]|nr:hypothetical protein [Tsukamurella tyrosinosolvens]